MPMPGFGQNFVQPSNTVGSILNTIFGGIGSAAQMRNQAQLSLWLHGEKAKIDTAEHDKRAMNTQMHKTAGLAASERLVGAERLEGLKNLSAATNASPTILNANGEEVHNPDFIDTGKISGVTATGVQFQKTGLTDRPVSEKKTKTATTNQTENEARFTTNSAGATEDTIKKPKMPKAKASKSTSSTVPMPGFKAPVFNEGE